MFGPARDLAGVESLGIEIPSEATLGEAMREVSHNHPDLAVGLLGREGSKPTFRCAVNQAFADPKHRLAEGDVVAVIPPVSGGSDISPEDYVALVERRVDRAQILDHVGGSDSIGASVLFEGITRAELHPTHGQLVSLCYEAYEPMAITEIQRLLSGAREQWPIERSAVVHRIGEVPLGEASVVIAVACGHRAEAFDACRWLIDQLKEDVPIWKKERWADQAESWVDPSREC